MKIEHYGDKEILYTIIFNFHFSFLPLVHI